MSNENGEDHAIDRLSHVRGGNHGAVTKLIKEAEATIKDRSGSKAAADVTPKLSSTESILKGKQSYLKTLDEQILQKCQMDDIEKEIEESADWVSKIQETIEKIKEYKIGNYSDLAKESVHSERVETFPPSTPITLNAEAVNDTVPGGAAVSSPRSAVSTPSIPNRSNEIINSNGIRLPKLNLPHHNGDVTKFHAFWQSFECAVHKNEHVSTINKLNYFKSLLEGQASRA